MTHKSTDVMPCTRERTDFCYCCGVEISPDYPHAELDKSGTVQKIIASIDSPRRENYNHWLISHQARYTSLPGRSVSRLSRGPTRVRDDGAKAKAYRAQWAAPERRSAPRDGSHGWFVWCVFWKCRISNTGRRLCRRDACRTAETSAPATTRGGGRWPAAATAQRHGVRLRLRLRPSPPALRVALAY